MCLENRVYDVRLEDGTHVVAKFYRPGRWSREAILDEHRFLADLRRAEIPVCAPIPFADGETLHAAHGIHYAVWRRTGGRAPDELRDDEIALLVAAAFASSARSASGSGGGLPERLLGALPVLVT
jgi:Ser/Thr protein kinase RdoA (MazF antagonist)